MKLYKVTYHILDKNHEVSFDLIVDSKIPIEDVGSYYKNNHKDFHDKVIKFNGENIDISFEFIRDISGTYLIDWTEYQPRG